MPRPFIAVRFADTSIRPIGQARRRWLTRAAGIPLALVLSGAARARRVAGVDFAERVTVAGAELQLNGVGLRAIPLLTGYAAGLYLDQRATATQAVLANPGPKRLQLRMMLDVDTREFVKAVDKGVARNTPAALQPGLSQRVARFNAMLRSVGKVVSGDVVDIDFHPAVGTVLWHNGRRHGESIAGADFYAAVLNIFIGSRPVDPELKTGLLGGPAS